MAETTTAKFAWTKPDPGASANTWGQTLNATTDKIDAQVYAIQQAGVPIGTVIMFAGGTAPTNWLLCQGQSLDTTTYAALYAIIGYAFGGSGANFNLPNLTQKFPIGAGPNVNGSSGGTFAVALGTANLPAHNHPAYQDAHNHGAWQDGHNHAITTGGHAHGISTGGHSHSISTGGHSHGNVLKRSAATGGVPAGVGFSGDEVGTSVGDLGGSASFVGSLGGNTDTAGNLGGSTDVRTPGVYTDNRQPAVYTQNTGSGTAFNVVPPFQAINFIIRYL